MRQGGVGDQRHRAFAEIIVVQAEYAAVRSEPEFMRGDCPGQIIVDEKAGGAPPLHPRIVKPSESSERRIGAAALEDDWKRRQGLLKIRRPKQALVPRERWVEVVHQVPGE